MSTGPISIVDFENFNTGNIWRHNKTGNIYATKGCVTNATNKCDGDVMVRYCSHYHTASDREYVRNVPEFIRKFVLVTGAC